MIQPELRALRFIIVVIRVTSLLIRILLMIISWVSSEGFTTCGQPEEIPNVDKQGNAGSSQN